MNELQTIENLNIINKLLMKLVSAGDWLPAELYLPMMLGVVFVVTVVVNRVVAFVLNHVIKNLIKRTKTVFDETLVMALHRPMLMFINTSGLLWAVQIVGEYNNRDLSDFLLVAWRLLGIVAFSWFLLRLTDAVEAHMVHKSKTRESKADSATILAVGRLLRLSVIIIMVLVILQNFGFSISGVLAFGGIGGIAIGFAARDLLANFFGGFMIFVDKPFHVGDWIRSPDRQIEGTVEDIGWRMTRIRTFDMRPLYVPNSAFMNIAVENPSRMFNRRFNQTIGLRYQDLDVVDAVVRDIKDMLYNHPDIDNKRTLIVAFDKFGDSSLDIMIYTFTKTTVWVEFYEIKERLLLLIRDIVRSHGADFAFPTQQLYITEKLSMEDPIPPIAQHIKPSVSVQDPEPQR